VNIGLKAGFGDFSFPGCRVGKASQQCHFLFFIDIEGKFPIFPTAINRLLVKKPECPVRKSGDEWKIWGLGA
jgi:hypothetical protein